MTRRLLSLVAVFLLALSLSQTGCFDSTGPDSTCTGSCRECGCPPGYTCQMLLGDPVPICRSGSIGAGYYASQNCSR